MDLQDGTGSRLIAKRKLSYVMGWLKAYLPNKAGSSTTEVR